ncbi:asparaginase [Falsigemmobacter faecalis]|uniref:Asparaginase n=1 Tax=Falsigemmobacter faecalis TaxID=2488730 RepID=A0A3P3D4U8_9RHOB|nr:asparaginase [Falsigemmobacter faecalis]RRH69409.1 asparaginase [Falsigemmobacter faecalis]
MTAVPMAELWRGGRMESRHRGHAVVWHSSGGLVEAWGDAGAMIFPRSSCKMIQALPLMESGAGAGLKPHQIALACASHQGAALHVEAVTRWLSDMEMSQSDLRCGCHEPSDLTERNRLIRAGEAPCQIHNNCSGKHTGFLMMNRHLKGDAEYVDPAHPLQRAIAQAHDEVTGESSPGFGIDGCSAPNFATSLTGLARAMAAFAGATGEGDARDRAMFTLARSMAAHPEYVAGEGRACTELMRAMDHRVSIKTGAEAVFIAIIPGKKLGMAVKIEDGNSRASEAAIAALLVRHGVLDAAHPAAQKRLNPVQKNWRGFETGDIRLSPGFPG